MLQVWILEAQASGFDPSRAPCPCLTRLPAPTAVPAQEDLSPQLGSGTHGQGH